MARANHTRRLAARTRTIGAALAATIALSTATVGTAVPSLETRSPRQPGSPQVGVVQWSQDGTSLLRWTGRGWMLTGWRRVFVASHERRVYDLRFNNVATTRIDEREPGWTLAIDYAGPFAGQPRKWPSHQPQNVFYLANNRWLSTEQYLAHLVAMLQQLAGQSQQPRASGSRPLKPGEIAPNVRREIPVNPALRTKEEKAYVERSNLQALGTLAQTSQRGICEFNQSSYPYNTVTGQIMPGWHDTVVGPVRNAC